MLLSVQNTEQSTTIIQSKPADHQGQRSFLPNFTHVFEWWPNFWLVNQRRRASAQMKELQPPHPMSSPSQITNVKWQPTIHFSLSLKRLFIRDQTEQKVSTLKQCQMNLADKRFVLKLCPNLIDEFADHLELSDLLVTSALEHSFWNFVQRRKREQNWKANVDRWVFLTMKSRRFSTQMHVYVSLTRHQNLHQQPFCPLHISKPTALWFGLLQTIFPRQRYVRHDRPLNPRRIKWHDKTCHKKRLSGNKD